MVRLRCCASSSMQRGFVDPHTVSGLRVLQKAHTQCLTRL